MTDTAAPPKPRPKQKRARKTPKPPKPVRAKAFMVQRAQAIRDLLVTDVAVAVLPVVETDPVRPFRIGIRDDFQARIKPGADPMALSWAIKRYTRSNPYYRACLLPDAMRHDIDGQPVEPVSDEHKTISQTALDEITEKERTKQKNQAAQKKAEAAKAAAKAEAEAKAQAAAPPPKPPKTRATLTLGWKKAP